MSRSRPDAGHALTPVQAGMVYEIYAGAGGVNLEQVVIHLTGEVLDLDRLAQVWGAAIARHPSLRMAVRQGGDGAFVQVETPPFAAPIAVEDWTGDADALRDWLVRDRARGVDVTRGDGWRLTVLRPDSALDLGPVALVWTFSHVTLDGRSFRAVLEDVFADYDGGRAAMAERPSFGALCDALAAVDTGPGRQFFAAYLSGLDAPTPVGFVHDVVENATAAGDGESGGESGGNVTREAALTVAQSAALAARAQVAGASFATMVQAAWGLVLSRVSGQADVMFGVTRSGRYLMPEARDAVGCLITTQPLRLRLTFNATLNDLLAAIRADLLAQRPYEGVGLPDIATVCDIPNGTPLFHSLVMVERQSLQTGLQAQGGAAWANRRVELHEQGAAPMTLAAYGDAALQLHLEYSPSQIAATDAARYLEYVTRLLVAMAEAPVGALLSDLDMLLPVETAGLLQLAQPVTPLPHLRPACIATAFEAVVARAPAAPALGMVAQERGFDFASLDQRANQLAHGLLQQGIGHGAIVGLCLPRCLDFVALMLAATKVGAAFLPMDPSYPPESLIHMAKDSGTTLIFAQTKVRWMADLPVTILSDDLYLATPTDRPDRSTLTTERSAYVIYTSGTTGKPKGVVVSQRSLVAHAQAAIAAYGLVPGDRVLQFGALSFDVALEEIVPTLLAGATLVLRDDAMMASPQAFVDAVKAEGLTVLNLPTGFWQVLLAALEAGTVQVPQHVRLVIVGGERMPPDALRRWQRIAGLPRLINAYGPTEATITCAMFEPMGPQDSTEVPVGRSFGHALSYLRSPDGSLAPMGARAELWVGGDAVALGYLHQPQLTAERFVANPFHGGDAGRLYRSGDMAHWRGDGQLVVAGRSDRQIKLRGFRIEPAEVEGVLETIPGVAQAHVGVREGRLIGWLRPSDAQSVPSTEAVAAYVATQLPAHKCPELVFVDEWPQTPGGKTDIGGLPAPAQGGQPVVDAEILSPQVARLAELFANILGSAMPSAGTSFFDLGGHSLQLLNLISQIETQFSTRLTVAQVHAAPTPHGLAALISGPGVAGAGADMFDCLMPIQPLGTGVPIYGVHVLGVNGSFLRPLAKAMGLDQPIFGLTVGLLSAQTPTRVADTAALYFRAIQEHRPTGPVGLVAVSLGSYMALELAQKLRAAGRDVRLLAMMDAAGPGGRDNIRGMAWVAAHWRLLRAGGMHHARGLIGAKMDSLRHRLEKWRLHFEGRFLRDTRVVTSVDGFVAANAVAIESYDPRPYDGRMLIIRAKDNPFDSAQAVATGLGWQDVAQGGFDVVDVPGNHLSILEEPGVLDVAAALAAALARSKAGMDRA